MIAILFWKLLLICKFCDNFIEQFDFESSFYG